MGDTTNASAGVQNATAIGANAFVATSNSLVLGAVSGTNGAGADTNVGVRTTAPNSHLQVNGTMAIAIRVSATFLEGLNTTDHVLVCTANNTVAFLPAAAGISGRVYIVKNRSGTALTVSPANGSGSTIDGGATLSVAINGTAMLITDGANWFKIN